MPTVSELSVEVTANVDQAIANMNQLSNAITVMGGHSQMQAAIFSRAGFLIADIGRSFEQAGRAGLTFFKSSLDLAVEYERTAALTATQARRVGGSLEEVAAIGRRVARDIPAAFAQMQPALYDIFSTTNLGVADAEKALRLFAKAAVAGQVDIRTASRASIDMMNAFGKEAHNLSEILDLQFKLVQVGKGEYSEVAANIGRASSSAVRAGQSMNEFAGVAAFISRFLPSMGNTVASTGRAFDSFSNPKVIERLKDMGVAATDIHNNFRPISDVMTDLGMKMKGLTDPQRAAAMQELFKGAGGTIQARRFFDIAVKQFGDLNRMTDEVAFGAGSMNEAYSTMFDTNAVKIQQFRNQWDLLRENIGTKLLPSLTPLLEFFNGLIDRFNKLSPGMQDIIIKTAVIGSGFLFLTGKVLGVIGAMLRFKAVILLLGELAAQKAAMQALGSGISVALGGAAQGATGLLGTLKAFGAFMFGPWGLIILAIVAVGVAIFLLVKHWDKVVEAAKTAWNWLQDIGGKIYDFFANVFGKVSDTISGWVQSVKDFFGGLADSIKGAFSAIGNFFKSVWNAITVGFSAAVEWIKKLPGAILAFIIELPEKIAFLLGQAVGIIISFWIDVFQLIFEWGPKIVSAVVTFFKELPGKIWGFLKESASKVWEGLQSMWQFAVEWVPKIFNAIIDWFVQLPERIWTFIKAVAQKWWEGVQLIWNTVIEWVPKIVQSVINFISGLPERIWNFVREMASRWWEGVKQLWEAVKEIGPKVLQAFEGIVTGIWDWIKNLPARLFRKAQEIGKAFVDGLKDKLDFHSPSLPERMFAAIAQSAFDSAKAAKSAIKSMNTSFASLSPALSGGPSFGVGYSPPPGTPGSGGPPTSPSMVVETMNVTSINPEDMSKDIAEEISWSLTVGGK